MSYILRASPPAAGPSVNWWLEGLAGETGLANCRQVDWWSGLFCIAKTDILETLRLHFGTLSDRFGDPGVTFPRFFCDLRWQSEESFRSMFLMILGWKCCLNAVAACVKTIIKTTFFIWFPCFHLFTNWCAVGEIWLTFGCILVTLGALFLIFKGPGVSLKCDDFSGVPWGSPGWEHRPRGW